MNKYITKLGEINADEKNIVTFPQGIPGYENLRKFILISPPEISPIMWLLSLENSNIGFPVVQPYFVKPDYEIDIPEDEMKFLKTDKPEDIFVISMLTLRKNPDDNTVNLLAPVVISLSNNIGIQIILENYNYNTRHNVKEELLKAKAAEKSGDK
ncbi:MAG TPA: flagellar assembly protein FliW [Tepiditoga sp.]|nr:flagellar assembly protein FliW [Thermotogota bacterium]HOO73892.1 flagellar assembly protein FliW [Tepiditoga sp.]